MKLTIFAAGSRGDIQPCLALGTGLVNAGYQVRLAAPENFADFVRPYPLEFYPLRGDVQAIMASDTGRQFMERGGGNPLKSIRAVRELIAPVVMHMAQDAYAACREADGLICLGVFSAFGQSIAEALHIPLMHIEPTPLLPSRAFPAPSWPIQRDLGGLHNALSGRAMFQVIWLWYRPFIEDFRAWLNLPPLTARGFYRAFRAVPMLGAYSPSLIPHPSDWPEHIHVSGYLYLDGDPGWQPSIELQAFLQAGPPPVYIGFGSMSGRNPETLADLILEALRHSGQRGLLLTGWGGLHTGNLPEDVFVLESVPHSWLFPRMAAVVHHGGAGTTAEGLRAGVPNLVLPFVLDQPFWGARLKALGVGPDPIPQKKLSAESLATAIHTAVTDSAMQARAKATGQAIRAENGLANAVKITQHYFGPPKAI